MKVMTKTMTGFSFEKKRKIHKIYIDISRVVFTPFHYKVKHPKKRNNHKIYADINRVVFTPFHYKVKHPKKKK